MFTKQEEELGAYEDPLPNFSSIYKNEKVECVTVVTFLEKLASVHVMRLDRHRGERHFENHRGGFSGDVHHHHHHHNHHQPNHHEHHHYNDRQQYNHHEVHNQYFNHYDHHSNNQYLNDESYGGGGGGFRPNGGRGFRPNGGGRFGPGHSGPLNGRKRFHQSGRGGSPDRGSCVKLYVASIPRTATAEDIRLLFEEHGKVVEVILLKDKRTGQQQGACFVKYAKLEEADRAIKVLHDLHAFPGVPETLKVRFAEGEQERLGALGDKLYVSCLYKDASQKEIEEVFSTYGVIEDIYIMRDDLKQNRGCFIKFSHRDMAMAAMNALNGTYTMRGCDQPLIVRFADPKKPRHGDARGNSAYGGPDFGPRSREPAIRLESNLDDPMGGRMLSNTSCLLNSGAAVQQISSPSAPDTVSQVAIQQQTASNVTQQSRLPLQQSPSWLPQMSSQLAQTFLESPGPSQQAVAEMSKQSDNLEQKLSSQVTSQQSLGTATTSTDTTAVSLSNTSTSPVLPESTTAAFLDCDWSEHICPDGHKYYFNCATLESSWEKPGQYSLFEQLAQKQLKSMSCQQELVTQSATSPVTARVQQAI